MTFAIANALEGGIGSTQTPPASRAHLSLQERKQRILLASWLCFGMAAMMFALAAFLAWNGRRI